MDKKQNTTPNTIHSSPLNHHPRLLKKQKTQNLIISRIIHYLLGSETKESYCSIQTMEARRLAILSSHLNPAGPYPILRVSDCSSGEGKVESSNLQNDCVFCKIIRGESPCLKVINSSLLFLFLPIPCTEQN